MFRRNSDLMPRTYSIKSYRRRHSIKYKKFFIFLTSFVILAGAAVVLALSFAHII